MARKADKVGGRGDGQSQGAGGAGGAQGPAAQEIPAGRTGAMNSRSGPPAASAGWPGSPLLPPSPRSQ